MNPTVEELRSEIRLVGDFFDTKAITDLFLNYAINAELQELYDLLVSLDEDFFVIPWEKTLTAGTTEYFLPDDFLSESKIYFIDASGSWATMERMQFETLDDKKNVNSTAFSRVLGVKIPDYRIVGRKLYLLPSDAVVTGSKVHMLYVPQLPQMAAKDEIPLSIPVAWRDFVVTGGIARCNIREESDPTPWEIKKEQVKQRIMVIGKKRNTGKPATVIDVHRRDL